MLAVYGFMALAVGALVLRACTIIRLDPKSSAWFRQGASFRTGYRVVVGILYAAAAALFGVFAFTFKAGSFGNFEALYLTPALVVAALAWGMLKRYADRRGVVIGGEKAA